MTPYLEIIKKRRSEKIDNILNILSIFPTMDTRLKREILMSCVPTLRDKRVFTQWIEILAGEKDDEVKALMLYHLPPISEPTKELADQYIGALVSCLHLSTRHKERALLYMQELVDARPDLHKWFVARYAVENDNNIKAALIQPLLNVRIPDEQLTVFFRSILSEVDETFKYNLLNRLFEREALTIEEISTHLHPSEPKAIKFLILNYLEDRTIFPPEVLKELYVLETDTEIKTKLLHLFLKAHQKLQPSTIDFLLLRLQKETDADMRHRFLSEFKQSIVINQYNADFFCSLLQGETDVDNAKLLVDWLAPYLSQLDSIKICFLKLLEEALDISLAILIIDWIGIHLPGDEALYRHYVSKYNNISHDRIKEAILTSLIHYSNPDKGLCHIFTEALASLSQSIKNLGLRGLLLLPMKDKMFGYLESSVDVLLDHSVSPDLKIEFARKIAHIPNKSEACQLRLKHIMSQTTNMTIQSIIEDGFTKDKNADAASSSIDWSWFEQQVKIEKNIDHIFPDIFIHFDENKGLAKELLRLMLMDSAFHHNLYIKHIDRRLILNFLITKDQIDLELTKYALNHLVKLKESEDIRGGDAVYLLALKNSLHLREIKDRLWVFFERDLISSFLSTSNSDLAAVRELFIQAYGEDVFYHKMIERLSTAPDLRSVKPYLEFIIAAPPWMYNPGLVDYVSVHKRKLPWALEIIRKKDMDRLSADFLDFSKKYGRRLFTLEEAVVLKKRKKGFKDD